MPLKVALDEHVPNDVARALRALSGSDRLLRVSIVSARQYAVPSAASDVPWLRRFAARGGNVVVSGDYRMRSRLHEQQALCEAGFIVFFMARAWNQMRCHEKCAMLIRWWPHILEKAQASRPGQFFELRHVWTGSDMRDVTPPYRLWAPSHPVIEPEVRKVAVRKPSPHSDPVRPHVPDPLR